MILAALQMEVVTGAVKANLAIIESVAIEAAGKGARILVLPEVALTGYGAGDMILLSAETADSAALGLLGELARRLDLALALRFAERDGKEVYNSAVFLSPDGWRVLHRKRFLYGAYEHALFTPGGDLSQPFRFDGTVVGLRVCFDVEFPESVRALALRGASLVLVPTALPRGQASSFIATKMVPTRAFENSLTIVYADHAGADERFAYAGRSEIAFADGTEGARAGPEGAELLIAVDDPVRILNTRSENDYLNALVHLDTSIKGARQ